MGGWGCVRERVGENNKTRESRITRGWMDALGVCFCLSVSLWVKCKWKWVWVWVRVWMEGRSGSALGMDVSA